MATESKPLTGMARYIAGLSAQTRSALASGIDTIEESKADRETSAIMKSIDHAASNTLQQLVDNAVSESVTDKTMEVIGRLEGHIVPPTIEESGLIDPNMVFDESQEEALDAMVKEQYVILMGAAGTGKTTLLRAAMGRIIYGWDGVPGIGINKLPGDQGPSIAIAAFTGQAGSVIKGMLPYWMHPAVKTIHSLLEFKPVEGNSGAFYPTRGVGNKLDHLFIVLDEMSMVGLNLWHYLMDAATCSISFILMGDINQLVPVADTPLFPYVLNESQRPGSRWKLCELKKVHRQKGIGGQRILDAAHEVLAGKVPTFDTIEAGKPWRVGFVAIPHKTEDAHRTIIRTLTALRTLRGVSEDGSTEDRFLYDPLEDLILTAGNGDDPNHKGAAIQQTPINQSLSRVIIPDTEDHPAYVIDCGFEEREYAVGDRIVCRQNESPGTKDRVTNGTVGFITKIEPNRSWNGDQTRFGTRAEVMAYQAKKVSQMLDPKLASEEHDNMLLAAMSSLDDLVMLDKDDRIQEKQASHIVTVRYRNGATRVYSSASKLCNTQLAYAITTTIAQGSQAKTVIIICHSAVAFQLNREWLYTGITRATDRVLIFGTDLGIRTAVSKQQIPGKTTQEKIERYGRMFEKGNKIVRLYPD